MIKKILSASIIIFVLFWLIQNNAFANKINKKHFRITAYYSPLPNQSHYIKWTYEKEIIMNGRGIRWASWKKVFSGMLAAPKNYSFWTKIKLKWLWVAEVADRWGAIVKAWERNFKYDRIDIWVGYWEKGLQRAMYWGNRIVEWEIIPKYSKNTLNISTIPAPRWTIYHATKNPDLIQKKGIIKRKIYLYWKKTIKNKKILALKQKTYSKDLFEWPIQNSAWVKNLQKKLTEMKLYSWKINWEYLSIRQIILDFQLKNNVISKKTDIWAGNFWPKTRKTLKQKYQEFKEEKEKKRIKKIKKEKEKKEARIKAEKRINSIWNIKFWDISHDVRMCQKTLKEVWFFEYKDTAIFWEKTKQSIMKYQLDRKIISNKNIYWAGMFWPKTRQSLINDLVKKSLEK